MTKRLGGWVILNLLLAPTGLVGQSGSSPSLPVVDSGPAAVFSVVPILGFSTKLGDRISPAVYGLYSTNPQVEILCVAAPVRLNQYFAFNPIYEFISPPTNAAGIRQTEHQINAAFDSGLTWKRLRLDNRQRVGKRWVHGAQDSIRYRNLLSASYPLSRDGLQLFHWQEFFFEGNVQRWDQHHLAVGLQRPLGKSLFGQLYYFRLAAVGRPDLHAMGLTMIYRWERGGVKKPVT